MLNSGTLGKLQNLKCLHGYFKSAGIVLQNSRTFTYQLNAVQWLWVQVYNQVIQVRYPGEAKKGLSFDKFCVQDQWGV